MCHKLARYTTGSWKTSPGGEHKNMTDEPDVLDGVDREQLAAFAGYAADHPDEVQFGLEARATYEGTCAHSLAKIDGYELGGETIERETRAYTLPFGAWKEVLAEGGWVDAIDRLEPTEAALAALAACINVGITVNAVAHGVDVSDLETRVSADFDPAVLFSLADLSEAENVFETLTVDVEIDGEDIEKDLVDEWVRRAPVYTLLSLEQDLEVSIGRRTPVATGN